MTRAKAIKRARLAYAGLMAHVLCRELADDAYVVGLFASWDRRLKEVALADPKAPVPDHSERRLAFLTREIRRKDLDPDAAVRWLDVYPEAIAEQFA